MVDEKTNEIRCPICNGKIYFYSIDVAKYEVVPEDIYSYVDALEEYRSIAFCEDCDKSPAVFLSAEPLERYVAYFSSRNHIHADLDEVPNERVKNLAKDVVDFSLRLFSFISSHYATWYSVPEKTWNNISSGVEIRNGSVWIGEGFLHIFLSRKGSLHVYKENGKYKVFVLADNKDILRALDSREIADALDKILSTIKLELERLKIIVSIEEMFG
jgi:hypothetical protein